MGISDKLATMSRVVLAWTALGHGRDLPETPNANDHLQLMAASSLWHLGFLGGSLDVPGAVTIICSEEARLHRFMCHDSLTIFPC